MTLFAGVAPAGERAASLAPVEHEAQVRGVLRQVNELVLAATPAPRSVIAGVGSLMFFADPEGNVFGAMQYEVQR